MVLVEQGNTSVTGYLGPSCLDLLARFIRDLLITNECVTVSRMMMIIFTAGGVFPVWPQFAGKSEEQLVVSQCSTSWCC